MKVTVCTENDFRTRVVPGKGTQLLATRIFARAGVPIDWRGLSLLPRAWPEDRIYHPHT